eukprot:m51a1_g10088 hypothetical protein (625) ;mRNA; r:88683-93353
MSSSDDELALPDEEDVADAKSSEAEAEEDEDVADEQSTARAEPSESDDEGGSDSEKLRKSEQESDEEFADDFEVEDLEEAKPPKPSAPKAPPRAPVAAKPRPKPKPQAASAGTSKPKPPPKEDLAHFRVKQPVVPKKFLAKKQSITKSGGSTPTLKDKKRTISAASEPPPRLPKGNIAEIANIKNAFRDKLIEKEHTIKTLQEEIRTLKNMGRVQDRALKQLDADTYPRQIAALNDELRIVKMQVREWQRKAAESEAVAKTEREGHVRVQDEMAELRAMFSSDSGAETLKTAIKARKAAEKELEETKAKCQELEKKLDTATKAPELRYPHLPRIRIRTLVKEKAKLTAAAEEAQGQLQEAQARLSTWQTMAKNRAPKFVKRGEANEAEEDLSVPLHSSSSSPTLNSVPAAPVAQAESPRSPLTKPIPHKRAKEEEEEVGQDELFDLLGEDSAKTSPAAAPVVEAHEIRIRTLVKEKAKLTAAAEEAQGQLQEAQARLSTWQTMAKNRAPKFVKRGEANEAEEDLSVPLHSSSSSPTLNSVPAAPVAQAESPRSPLTKPIPHKRAKEEEEEVGQDELFDLLGEDSAKTSPAAAPAAPVVAPSFAPPVKPIIFPNFPRVPGGKSMF